MKIIETHLKGCLLIEPIIHKDERGVFFESYHKRRLEAFLEDIIDFVQDNHSVSKQGVLRGLHFQKGKAAQAKLVEVVYGEVLDVVVDIRKDSPTFGGYFKTKLSDKNRKSLFIPKGMAHGFLALTPNVVFTYKCDNYYSRELESGIAYNDPDLNIDWEYPSKKLILSQKDAQLPRLKDIKI